MGVIYGIQAFNPTEMVYVGQTVTTPRLRYRHHLRYTKNEGLRAILDSRETRVVALEVCEDEDLAIAERAWIEYYLAHDVPLVNIVLTERNAPSVETREKIAEAARERWTDDRYRGKVAAKISKTLTGRPLSEEQRQAMIEGIRVHYASEAGQKHKEEISRFQRTRTEEASRQSLEAWQDAEYRSKVKSKKLVERPCRYCGFVCNGYEMMAHIRWHCTEAPTAKNRERKRCKLRKRLSLIHRHEDVRRRNRESNMRIRPCKYACGFVGTGYQMSAHIQYHCLNAPKREKTDE